MVCGYSQGRRKKPYVVIPEIFQTYNSIAGCRCHENTWCSYCEQWKNDVIFWENING